MKCLSWPRSWPPLCTLLTAARMLPPPSTYDNFLRSYSLQNREASPSSGANWASIFFSSPIAFHGVDSNLWKLYEAPVVPVDGPCVPHANLFAAARAWNNNFTWVSAVPSLSSIMCLTSIRTSLFYSNIFFDKLLPVKDDISHRVSTFPDLVSPLTDTPNHSLIDLRNSLNVILVQNA